MDALLLTLFAAAGVLVPTMPWLCLERRAARHATLALGAAVAAGLFAHGWLARHPLPAWAITVLQEGTGETVVAHLYGRGAHGGPLLELPARLFGGGIVLREVVHLNVALAVANAVLFGALARAVLGSWLGALGFLLALVLNVASVHAALSELPSQWLATLFFLGVLAAHGLRVAPTVAGRGLALASLVVLGLLAGLTRVECFAVALPAWVAGALWTWRGPEGVRDLEARGVAWLARLFSTSRLRLALLALGGLLLWVIGRVTVAGLALGKHAEVVVDGLSPVDFRFLLLPVTLLEALPPGLVVLVVAGVVHALRTPLHGFFLPFTLLFLYRLYVSSSHGAHYELFRYLTLLMAPVLFLGLFGWRELSRHLERLQAGPLARRGVALLLGCAMLVGPGTGQLAAFDVSERVGTPGFHQHLLRRDLQEETRYLLALTEREPECAFVTRLARPAFLRDRAPAYRWFGAPLAYPIDGGTSLEQAREALGRHRIAASCLRYYRGVDCHHPSTEGCPEATGLPLLTRERRVLHAYRDIPEYGYTEPSVELAVHALP